VSSLREGVNPLPVSNGTSEKHGGGQHEKSEPKGTTEQKIRKCLICRSPFLAAVCRSRRSSSAIRGMYCSWSRSESRKFAGSGDRYLPLS